MKKIILTYCLILCVLLSVAVTAVRADDGNGHDPGYQCVITVSCPTNGTPPQPASSLNNEATEEDTFLTLLELIITLLP